MCKYCRIVRQYLGGMFSCRLCWRKANRNKKG